MEMCYNGTLVMPKNCDVINCNEMEYIDGGGIPVWLANGMISAVFAAVGIGAGIKALRVLKGESGKYFAKKAVSGVAKKLGITIGATITGSIVNFLVDVCDPIGWLLGKLDKLDGSEDGWIGGGSWCKWTRLSMSNW